MEFTSLQNIRQYVYINSTRNMKGEIGLGIYEIEYLFKRCQKKFEAFKHENKCHIHNLNNFGCLAVIRKPLPRTMVKSIFFIRMLNSTLNLVFTFSYVFCNSEHIQSSSFIRQFLIWLETHLSSFSKPSWSCSFLHLKGLEALFVSCFFKKKAKLWWRGGKL